MEVRYRFSPLAALFLVCASLSRAQSCLSDEPISRSARVDRKVEIIDDDSLVRNFERRVGELKRKGSLVSSTVLNGQLNRVRGTVQLPDSSTVSKTPLTATEIYEIGRQASVVLAGFRPNGDRMQMQFSAAGCFINSNGLLATNYHVVAQEVSAKSPAAEGTTPPASTEFYLAIMNCDGEVFAVREIVAANKFSDVAFVETEARKTKPLVIGELLPPGSRLGVVTHPDSRYYSYTEGAVSRYYWVNAPVRTAWMAALAEIAEGSSGGPAIDEYGRLAGLVSFTDHLIASSGNNLPAREGEGGGGPRRRRGPSVQQMVIRNFVPPPSIRDLILKETGR